MKKLLSAFALALALASSVAAQITVPNTLVPGTVIKASDLNTNFSTLGNHALDRLGGGNLSGNVTADPGITIDGIDIGATICSVCAPTFKDLTLASPATGLTVGGNVIINTAGKIPALTTSYFASLAFDSANLTGTAAAINGSNITALNANNLSTGTVPVARVPTVLTSTSTGTVNDFNPGTLTGAVVHVRLNNATDLTLTGLVAGTDGQVVILTSIGAGNVFFKHANAGSSAGNRFLNFATSADTPLAAGAGAAVFVYDTTTTRWRLVAHEQGAPITPTYAGGDFTTTGAGGWTVDAGDVTTYQYVLHGRMLTVVFSIDTTSVIAATGSILKIKVPGGFTVNRNATTASGFLGDNATTATGGFTRVLSAGTVIEIQRNDGVAFTASTNNTYVRGELVFEVQ